MARLTYVAFPRTEKNDFLHKQHPFHFVQAMTPNTVHATNTTSVHVDALNCPGAEMAYALSESSSLI